MTKTQEQCVTKILLRDNQSEDSVTDYNGGNIATSSYLRSGLYSLLTHEAFLHAR